ncbi:hypothetical protein LSUE1_G005785 [Lachnellula suecica]|uniref:Uncharacterized protein n=1 Tax=Lachnellula suecica TaxID=602035 RepID=A0A8T9BYV9_9HELO|nr:hypothetical protein LSUE1_G005785 [Lachnellula suecica]
MNSHLGIFKRSGEATLLSLLILITQSKKRASTITPKCGRLTNRGLYTTTTHRSSSLSSSTKSLAGEISSWDGAAETHVSPALAAALTNSAEGPKWVMDYYREVVLVDERRFLVSNATEHLKMVEVGSVVGEKRVVIEDGKCKIEVPESVWEVWREYEKRGEDRGA